MLKQTQLISFILEAGAILALVFWDEINLPSERLCKYVCKRGSLSLFFFI
jgi:hypothetical protein